MSKRNNVNPGQYKVGGREKPDTIAAERMKGARPESAAGKGGMKKRPAANKRKG